MVNKHVLWTVASLFAMALGFLAGNSRASWECEKQFATVRKMQDRKDGQYRESFLTLAEQVRRVKEAQETNDPALPGHISTLESYARRLEHLPQETPTGVDP